MISLAAKVLLGATAVALGSAIALAVTVGDYVGVAILAFLAIATAIVAVSIIGAGVREPAYDVATDAQPPAYGSSRPSVWPLAAAVALAVTAVGAAVGSGFVALGLVALVAALGGWFAHAWTEHPTWNDEVGQRMTDRLLLPIGLPLGMLLLVGVLVISFSRVLLAIPKNGSVVAALLAALAILGACAAIAARPKVSSSMLLAVALVAGLLTIAGGVGGAVAGEREFHHEAEHEAESASGEAKDDATDADSGQEGGPTGDNVAGEEEPDDGDAAAVDANASTEADVTAKGLAFNKQKLTFAAGQPLKIVFTNAEAIPHNFALTSVDTKTVIDKTDIITGPDAKATLELSPLEAGEYAFMCQVHPPMKGSVAVG